MAAGSELLAELLKPSRLTSVVDAGLGPAAQPSPYGAMLGKRLCSVVGLDPRLDSRQRPNQIRSDLETHLAVTAGDGAPATLKLCTAPGMNSLLAPNPQVLDCFPLYAGFSGIIEERPLETRRLDDIAEIAALDFLKIDMQGSETAAFRGGRVRLAEAVVVQTEVCFMELYKGQALFGEIDREMRSMGFVPHVFKPVAKALIVPFHFQKDHYATINHALFRDVIYVRDFTRPDDMSVEQLKQLALLAHYCFGSYDLAAKCIRDLEQRNAVASGMLATYSNGLPSN